MQEIGVWSRAILVRLPHDVHRFQTDDDAGVFTELISNMGCKGVQVEEIWSLDPEFTADLG